MSDTLWIVVANAARARLYERHRDGSLDEPVDLIHPQARQSSRDLTSDRSGRTERGSGAQQHGHTAYQPATDAHQKEHERFAREVAAQLDDGVASGRCRSLLLFAAPAFLGELRQRLGEATAKAVRTSEAIDLTSLPVHELRARVSASLLPR